jgi:hypothetical protein
VSTSQSSSSHYSITGLHPYPWINWWYRLVAPPVPPHAEELPLREREFLRRGKLTSIALLIEFIEMFIAIEAGIQNDNKAVLPLLLSVVATLIVACVLTRFRKPLWAGVLLMIVLDFGLIGNFTGSPDGLIGIFQLPTLCLWVQPLMISVLLFSAWGVLVVGSLNSILIYSLLLFMPHTAELQFYLRTQPYVVYSIPITLQVVSALISFIVITSLQESMIRADKAEEVSRLLQMLAEIADRELETKRQQDAWFEQISSVMTRIANGDWNARIPHVEANSTFTPVSRSINNMIGRYARQREQARPIELTAEAVQKHLHAIRIAKVSGAPVSLRPTGTPTDQLVEEVRKLSGKHSQETRPFSSQRPEQ